MIKARAEASPSAARKASSSLAKTVLETALAVELSERPSYDSTTLPVVIGDSHNGAAPRPCSLRSSPCSLRCHAELEASVEPVIVLKRWPPRPHRCEMTLVT